MQCSNQIYSILCSTESHRQLEAWLIECVQAANNYQHLTLSRAQHFSFTFRVSTAATRCASPAGICVRAAYIS